MCGKFPLGSLKRLTRLDTGKFSSLDVPPLAPITKLAADVTAYKIPITLIDTIAPPDETLENLPNEFFEVGADSIILTYECQRSDMYMKLMKFWLPNIKFLRSHLEDMSKQHVPLIVVGMKEDLRKGVGCEYGDSEARFGLLALDFPNLIETYMEVSIRQNPAEAREVLHYSLKGVMHPIGPLFDCEEKCLSFRLIRALSRILNVYDTDKDGFLSEEDLKVMHQASYGEQLDAFGIEEIKDLFTYIFPQGFDHRGLSLEGFFHLHSMYAKRGCYEHTWALLASAGYNMEVKFREDIVPLMTSKAECSAQVFGA